MEQAGKCFSNSSAAQLPYATANRTIRPREMAESGSLALKVSSERLRLDERVHGSKASARSLCSERRSTPRAARSPRFLGGARDHPCALPCVYPRTVRSRRRECGYRWPSDSRSRRPRERRFLSGGRSQLRAAIGVFDFADSRIARSASRLNSAIESSVCLCASPRRTDS
jgi:hypothetical protein